MKKEGREKECEKKKKMEREERQTGRERRYFNSTI